MKSQNGWEVFTSGTDVNLVAIKPITGRVRKGAVEIIFKDLIKWFNDNIESVTEGHARDDWGWAYRAVRGKTSGFSNHASGTAIDLNATQHPLGVRNTFSLQQQAKIRARMKFYEGVVRWGGDYTNRKDDMHFEINVGPDSPKLQKVVSKISGTLVTPSPSTGTTKTPATMAQEIMAGKHGNGHSTRMKNLGVSTSVYEQVKKEVDKLLKAKNPSTPVPAVYAIPQHYSKKPFPVIKVDGKLGSATLDRLRMQLNIKPSGADGWEHYDVRALKVWLGNKDNRTGILSKLNVQQLQYRVGLRGKQQDGIIGPQTITALQKFLNNHRK